MIAERRFTLVELLVVVAVISALMALFLPALSQAKAKGLQIACLSNGKQAFTSVQLYASDFNDFMPIVANSSYGPASNWWRCVAPYLNANAAVDTPNIHGAVGRILQCPQHSRKMASLAGNPSMSDYISLSMNWVLGPNGNRPYFRRAGWFLSPSDTICITEAGLGSPSYAPISQCDDNWLLYSSCWYQNTNGVHNGSNSILWLDGHAMQWYGISSLNSPPYSQGSSEDKWCRGRNPLNP